MSTEEESKNWTVVKKNRKQLKMIHIPVRIVKKFNVKDGEPLLIKISAKDEEIFRDTIKPTSGEEICLTKHTVKMLQARGDEEFKFSLL